MKVRKTTKKESQKKKPKLTLVGRQRKLRVVSKESAEPKLARTKLKKTASPVKLRLIEKRMHPRFLLTHEQFRDAKTGKVFQVYDLSLNGLSIRVDQQNWKVGQIVQGILNLNIDSIEITPRVVSYYGDRVALKIEVLSTYGREVLNRALSARRLGASLRLIKEKLPVADFWYHGVCNTDLLIGINEKAALSKFELFFSNFYCAFNDGPIRTGLATGLCQSWGNLKREEFILSEEPVKLESMNISLDDAVDESKLGFARSILEFAPMEEKLKNLLLQKFK